MKSALLFLVLPVWAPMMGIIAGMQVRDRGMVLRSAGLLALAPVIVAITGAVAVFVGIRLGILFTIRQIG